VVQQGDAILQISLCKDHHIVSKSHKVDGPFATTTESSPFECLIDRVQVDVRQ
jgi:hypothetical protein